MMRQGKQRLIGPVIDDNDVLQDYQGEEDEDQNLGKRFENASNREIACHRLRFIDYKPSAISALACSPNNFDLHTLYPFADSSRGLLAIGRSNGQVEIHAWLGGLHASDLPGRKMHKTRVNRSGNRQTWVLQEVLPADKHGLAIERLVWSHRSTLTPDEEELFEDDDDDAQTRDQLVKKVQHTPPRLFSTNGTFEISEWQYCNTSNMTTRVGDVKRRLVLASNSAVTDLACNATSTVLAAACTNGVIQLISIVDDEFSVLRQLDSAGTNARLLSLAWGPSDHKGQQSYIVAGGSDSTLRKWDTKSGRTLSKMTLAKANAKQHTYVWSVAVTTDHTIVTGDSLGNVTFWDGKTDTQTQLYKAHKSDVLCLAIAQDGKALFSASSDQRACQFTLVPAVDRKRRSAWTLVITRRIHSHDVRALVHSPPYTFPIHNQHPKVDVSVLPILISGGIDMSLHLTPARTDEHATSTVKKDVSSIQYGPLANDADFSFASGPGLNLSYTTHLEREALVSVARQPRLVLLKRSDSVTVWKVGVQPTQSLQQRKNKKHASAATGAPWSRLADIKLNGSGAITLSKISPDGQWILISDLWQIKLFKFTQIKGEEPIIKRVKQLDALFQSDPIVSAVPHLAASAASFTPNGKQVVIATRPTPGHPSCIIVLALPVKDQPLSIHKAWSMPTATLISFNGRQLAGPSRLRQTLNGNANAGNGNGNGNANGHAHVNGHAHAHSDDASEDEAAVQIETRDTASLAVVSMTISTDGAWLAMADSGRGVSVYNLDTFQLHCNFPTVPYPIADMAFSPTLSNVLVVGLQNCQVYVYDVMEKGFASWAEDFILSPPAIMLEPKDALIGLSFEPARKDASHSLCLWGPTFVTSLTVPSQASIDALKEAKSSGSKRTADDLLVHIKKQASFSTVNMKRKYRDVLALDFFQHGEMMIVERPYIDLLEHLPPAVYVRTYGK